VRLDDVQDRHRLTPGRDQVEPAPGPDLPLVEADDGTRDGVGAAEVVEEPSVDALLAQGGLDAREIHEVGIILAPSHHDS